MPGTVNPRCNKVNEVGNEEYRAIQQFSPLTTKCSNQISRDNPTAGVSVKYYLCEMKTNLLRHKEKKPNLQGANLACAFTVVALLQ